MRRKFWLYGIPAVGTQRSEYSVAFESHAGLHWWQKNIYIEDGNH